MTPVSPFKVVIGGMDVSVDGAGADVHLLRHSRRCHVLLERPAASREHLADYLALVERPVRALLARDRLEAIGAGRFVYRSRPTRVLGWRLRPVLDLQADWDGRRLEIRSLRCSLDGYGHWEQGLELSLGAELQAADSKLEAEAWLSLKPPTAVLPLARRLAPAALNPALARMEARLQRGLRQDLLAWLEIRGA